MAGSCGTEQHQDVAQHHVISKSHDVDRVDSGVLPLSVERRSSSLLGINAVDVDHNAVPFEDDTVTMVEVRSEVHDVHSVVFPVSIKFLAELNVENVRVCVMLVRYDVQWYS